jgi:hypothetical protein
MVLVFVSAAHAGTLTQSFSLSITSGSASVPLGVAAPSGYHWVLVFDDEFTQDSSIDLTNWAIQGNVYLDGANGIALAADPSTPSVRVSLCRITPNSSNFCYANSPMQIYGYWESNWKYPVAAGGLADGYHDDWWVRDAVSNSGEVDMAETIPPQSCCSIPQTNEFCFSCLDDASYAYPSPPVGDLSSAYHTYGMWWYNDGSANGSVQVFFDGQPISSANAFDSEFSTGMAEKFTIDPCYSSCDSNTSNNNPWFIKYERVWQLEPD